MSDLWSLDALDDLARSALVRSGASHDVAKSVSRSLVLAEVDGQYGHGLRRLESYCPQVRVGKIDGKAIPEIRETATACARVDAVSGFAFPALDMATEWLGRKTLQTGIAATGVYHSHHCGVAGHWVERLADAGLVALMFANTPAAISPAGGDKPLFGTNPIAFAAPRADAAPLVIDLSLSQVARGKIMAAHQKGETIPEGWALDAKGQQTTDPEAALSGSMMPIGGPKGAALAMMVELLAAGLTGGNYGYDASSFLNAEGVPPGTGQLLIALSPMALGGEGFSSRIENLCETILAQQGTRLPGASLSRRRKEALENGISVEPTLISMVEAI